MNTNAIDSAIRKIATTSISGYQKHISPRKGFSCAHRLLHGGESCSQYVKRMITKKGLVVAIRASRQRFEACREANQILRAKNYFSSSDENKGKRDKKAKSTQPERTNCPQLLECGDCPMLEIPVDCLNCGSGLDCGAADCGAVGDHFHALDCSSGLDCGTLDCGALDCGGCGG